MLRIVTDGGADMPSDWLEQYHIDMLPLQIRMGERTYTQGVDIDQQSFYQMVAAAQEIPKTSLPAPHRIAAFYRTMAERGDTILSIHIASKMSGTFAAVQMAAQEVLGEFHVIPFDSGAGSAALGFMCREARLLDQAGFSPAEILQRLDRIRQQLTVIFTLDTLDFARMNGRVSALQSTLVSVLKIKPIILLRDGLLDMVERVRTRQNALERILTLARNQVGSRRVRVAVVHAADAHTAEQMKEQVSRLFNCVEVVMTDLAIPVAANLGPRTIGLVAIPLEEEA